MFKYSILNNNTSIRKKTVFQKGFNRMTKQGKFKLLSYFIENNLIFYASLNKVKKILAFCIIESHDISKIVEILNEFWNKGTLNSYAIQINIGDDYSFNLIVRFKSFDKEAIVSSFNTFITKLETTGRSFSLKNGKELEKEFLKNLFDGRSFDLKNVAVFNIDDNLIVKDENSALFYNFYWIKLDMISDTKNFISNFITFAKDKKIEGYVILSFITNKLGELQVSTYFVEKKREITPRIDVVQAFNSFFNANMIQRQKLDNNVVFKCLWRLPIPKPERFVYNLNEIFTFKTKYDFQDKKKLRFQIENSLKEKDIDYNLLTDNVILINNKILFSMFSTPDLNSISQLIKNSINRYLIYILIVNEEFYTKFTNLNHMSEIKNLKILNPKAFNNLDFEVFKQ